MSDAEAKLATFWRQDRPMSFDAAFRLAVLERRARQRLYSSIAWIAAAGALTAGCVAEMSPKLSAGIAALPASGTVPVLSVIGTCAILFWVYTRARESF